MPNKPSRSCRWPRAASFLLALAGAIAFAVPARAADYFWTGSTATGGNGTWSNVNNWSTIVSGTVRPSSGPTATDDVYFGITNATSAATVTLTADAAAYSITQSTQTGNLTISGNGGATDRTLTVGAGGFTTLQNSGLTIGNAGSTNRVNVRLDGSQIWSGTTAGGSQNLTINNVISRVAGDTNNRTLVFNWGSGFQQLVSLGTVQDGGGGSGSLGVWNTGIATLQFSGSSSYTGPTTLSSGRIWIQADQLPTSGTLTLRGTWGTNNTRWGVMIGTGSVATPKIRVEAGVNTFAVGVTAVGSAAGSGTANLGTITRTGGVARFERIGTGSTAYLVGNSNNSAGILGAWALASINDWVTVSSGTLAIATSSTVTETGLTSVNGVYKLSADASLTASRSAYVIGSSNNFGRTLTLNSNDLTVSGFTATSGGWIITQGSGTGRLVIGSDNELVLTGATGYTISAPVVDGAAAGKITFASTGVATLELSGSNSHSGGTEVAATTGAATIRLQNPYALGSGTFWINPVGETRTGLILTNTSASPITIATNNAQVWNGNLQFSGTSGLNMGTGTVSLGVTPGTVRTVTVNSSTFTIGGRIMDGTADVPTTVLSKAGVGTLVLSGSNTFTGGFTISAGTIGLNNANALGTGTASFTGNSTLVAGVTGTVANAVTVGSGVVATVDTQSNNLRFSGAVSGAGGLTKLGSGRLQLTSANTYAGTTTISAGQFLVDGSGSLATAGVVVNGSGAELKWNSSNALTAPLTMTQGTLSGTGSISALGGVTIGTNDTLSPGNSPGSQSFTTGLTLTPGGTYVWETNSGTGTKGVNWDLINVTAGGLDLSSLSDTAKFTLDLTTLTAGGSSGPMDNYTAGGSYTWRIFDANALTLPGSFGSAPYAAGTNLTSLFNLVTTNWKNTPAPASNDISVKVASDGTGIDLVVVPEPTTIVLAGIGIAAAVCALRRRR